MKNITQILCICLLVLTGSSLVLAEEAPQKVIDRANTEWKQFGTDPIIVNAVKEQNNQGLSLSEIKSRDEKWQATPGYDDFMTSLMKSECAKHITEIQNSTDYYAEIFVMDNQGANVAMTAKTSDYWQGDEAKFQKAFADGAGEVFVDEVEFDDSTQTYLVQVSVPVMDGEKAIGVVTLGIDVDKLE